MNMQNLMAQAQKIQKEIQKKQSEIDSTIFTGKSDFVSVEVYGTKKIHKLNINKDVLNDKEDLDMLEDMITIAINSAFSQVDKEIEKKLGSYGKGLNGLI